VERLRDEGVNFAIRAADWNNAIYSSTATTTVTTTTTTSNTVRLEVYEHMPHVWQQFSYLPSAKQGIKNAAAWIKAVVAGGKVGGWVLVKENGKVEAMENGKMKAMENGKMKAMENGKVEVMEKGKVEVMRVTKEQLEHLSQEDEEGKKRDE